MTLRDYVDILKKWWTVIAALALVGAVVGGAAALMVPTKYQSSSQLYVSIPTNDSATELNQAATYLSRELKSYTTVATSPYVLDPVRRDTGLDDSVEQLQAMLDVTNPTATSVIQVSATADTPEKAQTLANGVAEQLTKGVGSLSPEVANRSGAVKAEVLSKAERPEASTGLPSWVYPVGGIVLGALVGTVLAFILESLVRRPRTVRDLRDVPGVTLAASVPRLKHRSDARTFDPAAAGSTGSEESTPQITALRSRLQQRHAEVLPHVEGSAVVAVTGSRTGDGASTVALELARSFAGLGSRVVLVDAHLSDRGLTTLLAQGSHLGISDIVQQWGLAEQSAVQLQQGLTFLPAGSATTRPSDLVCSESMVTLLRDLEREFDVVILDCSPLSESADAAVLGELSDEVLLVTVPGHVATEQLQNSVESFRGSRVSVVANKVRSSRGRSGLL
ncbi:polysaccharide biosynthesis tyrosine autokinase [Kocuria sp.]|uniref:polysaccharide biosynthesis tyrosine autokinase n=1 Tax=Kocuria sp. TaxID=1871328 RepID=UPI0026DDB134|nr:polysaccharide biosynthesis tyrosine autokinase [Kocuria sp.]MDO4920111.1 cellulose synthase operon protein YhjQ/BcsQ [Kocuria sp.]